MQKKNSPFLILTFVVVILSIFNCYMYVFRYHHGYMYTQAFNYNELYFPDENYRIQNVENLPDDSLKVTVLPAAKLPEIKLLAGKHRYAIKALGAKGLDSVTMEIEYNPLDKSTYVSFCNLPIIEYPLYPISYWTSLPKDISTQEISEVKKIIKDSIGISDSSSTSGKIIKIGKYLVHKLRPSQGIPSDTIKHLTPLRQYLLACERKDHIDCGNYSDIYFLFANCAGIPTRRIGVAGRLNKVITSGHVFDESYIKEQKRWAFVDLTSKKLLVLADTEKVLNTIDLLNINTAGIYGSIKAIVLDSSNRIDTVPYKQVNNSEIEYFKPTAKFYYIHTDINNNMGFIDSFKEYLGEKSHYGIYYSGTLKIENGRHYLKLFVFKTFVGLFLLWIVLLIWRALR